MKKEIEMTAGQMKRVNRLIEAECCNCVNSICIIQDRGYGWYCPQLGTQLLFCPWFKDAVLPMDEKLRRDLIGDIRMKQCETCRREFSPKSNRARFCPICALKNRRKKKTEWMRNNRHPCGRLEA